MLNYLNTLLISKSGMLVLIVILLGTCGWVGYYFSNESNFIVKEQELFFEHQIEQGFVAMSEVHKTNSIVTKALLLGAFTEEYRKNFELSVDFLYVRATHFRNLYPRSGDFPSARKALEKLDQIVKISDEFSQNSFSNVTQFARDLGKISDQIVIDLYHYLYHLSREQRRIMSDQSHEVLKKTHIFGFSIVALSILGAAALLLLRREVIVRRSRDIAEKRVKFLAFYDSLTKIPNRVQFQDYLQEMLNCRHSEFSVFIVDIDHFKDINDKFGHAIGDKVLCHSANIFSEIITAYKGLPARLSGDEFAAIVPEDDLSVLKKICEEILSKSSGPYCIDGEHINASLSIGVATTRQVKINNLLSETLIMRIADFSLYESKQAGRGQFMIYDDTLEAIFQDRDKMKEELPYAIRQGEFKVFLQPQATLPDGKVYGFEALVRWLRNDKLCMPDSFIPIAESTYDIIDIDFFMLNEAIRIVAQWNQKYATAYSVSINLSALHLSEQKIHKELQQALEKSNMPAELVILEITETIQLKDWKKVENTLKILRQMGVRVAIDDFGCGYSSLAYLRTMTVDELKIDRSLLTEIETSKEARYVVSAVVDLAKNLDIDVIVEGVEEKNQADIAFSIGVGRMQGYLVGKPIPALEALTAAGISNQKCMQTQGPNTKNIMLSNSFSPLKFHGHFFQ